MNENLKAVVYQALETQPASLGQFILEYFAQREHAVGTLVAAGDLENALTLCRSTLFSAKEISAIAFDEISQQLSGIAAGIEDKLKTLSE